MTRDGARRRTRRSPITVIGVVLTEPPPLDSTAPGANALPRFFSWKKAPIWIRVSKPCPNHSRFCASDGSQRYGPFLCASYLQARAMGSSRGLVCAQAALRSVPLLQHRPLRFFVGRLGLLADDRRSSKR
jgi:hypothetical protein